ncbi:hypothetical protein FSARC_14072 [Fusarium sarcochroum]|uniref:Rhodopsin domain-containing protein n=1 Tax=Fusarium sarcochroum TaxID=1208366 RepID=A0A8H4SWH0_9HYPO|nr:hypothetical protein FSARC_14072 [Fusarium sarcochroum]
MVNNTASIAIQALLLVLALVVLILRCWARILLKQSLLNLSDLFAWLGWLFTLGWFICSTLALRILIDTPAVGTELTVNSVAYLKIVFAAQFLFDIGIYFSKISITLFYWTLIPRVMGPLRQILLAISVYLGCTLIATILTDTLITRPISNNWSIENQLESVWNSYAAFCVQWALNFSTDLLVFIYPFFLLKHLSLRKEQTLGLIGVFSLGAITLIVSLTRFIAYNATDFELEDEIGNILSTAEMSTAVIVVCLPGLRRFLGRSKSPAQSSGHTSGYGAHSVLSRSGQTSANNTSKPRPPPSSYAKWGVRDDEIGLVTHIRAGNSTEFSDLERRSADGKSGKSVTV